MEDLARLAAVYADEHCAWCGGRGINRKLCGCVRRRAFHVALSNYHASPRCSIRWLLFRADFMLTVKKLLSPREMRAFTQFFLEGAEWIQAAPTLRLTRGAFFHWVYSTEQKIGEELIERGIFPLYTYFGGPHRPRPELVKGRSRGKTVGAWGASNAYAVLAAAA